MLSSTLDLYDKPTIEPGQLSESGVLAVYYKGCLNLAYAELDKLPMLYESGMISYETYFRLDLCLCVTIDTHLEILTMLGHPQPQRSR